jgi:DNA-binding FadR family transcriptional regulator
MITQTKLYEQIEEALATEIAHGIYKPGDFLPTERELMERFDVGRPSVREAIFSLARRGLVMAGSGRRPRVLEPSFDTVIGELNLIVRQVLQKPDNIFHLLEVRRFLECALARKAASEATDTQIAQLRNCLAANRDALGNMRRFWETDVNFHAYIARMSGNPILPVIVDTVLDWLINNRRITLTSENSDEVAYGHHDTIFQAIEARDPDRAEAAMENHLAVVERRVSLFLIKELSKSGTDIDRKSREANPM